MMNVFEEPWLLLIVAGVVFLGVAIFRDALPPKRTWAFWLLPIVIALTAFGLDYFVQTDKEKIQTTLAKACKAVETENINALQPLMSNDYRDSVHSSKQELLDHFRARLDEPIIEKIVPAIVSLEINPPTAKAVFTARVMLDPRGPIYEYQKMMVFKLEAELRKEAGKWLFTKVEITAINFQPAGWKNTQGSPEGVL
jgi:hypothetical protein